jgi:hypothetical protein
MTKLLEEALAKVAMLPLAAQEKIGEELLLHVESVDHLRAEVTKGIQSLDRGEGLELDVPDIIKRARREYARE